MLTLAQVQIIIAQNIRRVVTINQTYSPNKTFEKMGIDNSDSFNIFVKSIYEDKAIGLPFYNYTLPTTAFDDLNQTSKLKEAQDILQTATEISPVRRNPIFLI